MRRQVLSPIDRVSEVLFGLIMVLTFTGSLSIAEAGREDVRMMLIAALGCNLAWGIIDGILYIMGSLADESQGLLTFRSVRDSTSPEQGRQLVAGALPPLVAAVLTPDELESIRGRLTALPAPPARAPIGRATWLGAVGVFLMVFLSTFPVVIPFIVMRGDAVTALRVSNGIAVGLLFITGFAFGRITGRRPWVMGISMVVLGAALVSITMALGG